MIRQVHTFALDNPTEWKEKLLLWTQKFRAVCILDNHNYRYPGPFEASFEYLVGTESVDEFTSTEGNTISRLEAAFEENPDWWLGGFSYDLKNELEDLRSDNTDGLHFPKARFFVPKYLWLLKNDCLELHVREKDSVDSKMLFDELSALEIKPISPKKTEVESSINWHTRINKQSYLEKFETIQEHIRRGDIYEMNFCREYFAEGVHLDPNSLYAELQSRTKAPFSAFWRWNSEYVLSASPERYITKKGSTLLSQPIKGTATRSLDPMEDERLANALHESRKERGENVMIVDLVRNDLSKVASKNSVEVSELFGVYSFPTVHQLISTVQCTLNENNSWAQAIEATFPMGSMTGAPKISAMNIIESVEESARGWYSGALGYLHPSDKEGEGHRADFDFNVIIRSLIYRSDIGYLSAQVGGAITVLSDGEEEWNETELKAKALLAAANAAMRSI